jgi:hypothetical protein
VLVGGVTAAAVVVLFDGGSPDAGPTKAQYLARVAAICRTYGPRLDRIPPPADLGIPAELAAAARRALPLLRAEAAAVSRLEVPRQLRTSVSRWSRLNDLSISKLASAVGEERRKNLQGIQIAYVQFLAAGAKAQRLGRTIGFPRPPC